VSDQLDGQPAADYSAEDPGAHDLSAGGRPLSPATGSAARTGHPAVDAVLDSLDALDELPVGDQVAAFETAHDRLRVVLADAASTEQPGGAGPAAG
jgi:hypothetical protein